MSDGPIEPQLPDGVSWTGLDDDGDHEFSFFINGVEHLRVSPEGFYVEGRYVTTDAEIFAAVKHWAKKYLKENPDYES